MNFKAVDKLAQGIYNKMKVPCNCGGPQYGTDHSPDCNVNLAWDDAVEEAKDRLYNDR